MLKPPPLLSGLFELMYFTVYILKNGLGKDPEIGMVPEIEISC